jgi:ribosomal-protein-alanine N-acetyltransferase
VVAARGELTGYLLSQRLPDEWHVLDLGVAPEARRMGIGRLLLENLISVTDGQGTAITLEVRVSNIAAISLYEGLGFVSHGRRPAYYRDNGEDAEIMWRAPHPPKDAL